MATKDEILSAVAIVREFANNPVVGSVKELLDALEESINTPVASKSSTVVAPVVAKESN